MSTKDTIIHAAIEWGLGSEAPASYGNVSRVLRTKRPRLELIHGLARVFDCAQGLILGSVERLVGELDVPATPLACLLRQLQQTEELRAWHVALTTGLDDQPVKDECEDGPAGVKEGAVDDAEDLVLACLYGAGVTERVMERGESGEVRGEGCTCTMKDIRLASMLYSDLTFSS